ncbi:MAG: hypothetical protein QOH96_4011, partial [Blastocatellia bacterium]|nr:hypothetical protein [Blastocatellia bacterium]
MAGGSPFPVEVDAPGVRAESGDQLRDAGPRIHQAAEKSRRPAEERQHVAE